MQSLQVTTSNLTNTHQRGTISAASLNGKSQSWTDTSPQGRAFWSRLPVVDARSWLCVVRASRLRASNAARPCSGPARPCSTNWASPAVWSFVQRTKYPQARLSIAVLLSAGRGTPTFPLDSEESPFCTICASARYPVLRSCSLSFPEIYLHTTRPLLTGQRVSADFFCEGGKTRRRSETISAGALATLSPVRKWRPSSMQLGFD